MLPREVPRFRQFQRRVSSHVKIVEVGPRDGLQNEPNTVPTAVKLELIKRLASAGLTTIEATSFVSPKWVPQMADNAELYRKLKTDGGLKSINLPVLVPNLKGLEGALSSGAREVAIFTTPSEQFSQKNANTSVSDSLKTMEAIVKTARGKGVDRVRGYVSCVIGCPYEGPMDPMRVLEMSKALLAMGCYEVSLGDTIGVGTPGTVAKLLTLLTRHIDPAKLALHCHDTYGQALANIHVGIERYGIRTVDSAVAGLGGCPFAAGATGNVATEDVVYMLQGMNYDTGANLLELSRAGQFISEALNRRNESRAGRAILAKLRVPEN